MKTRQGGKTEDYRFEKGLERARTLTVCEWYFRDPDSAQVQQRIRRVVEFSDEIQREDIEICEAVQRGLASRTYDTGSYRSRRENGVHHFHGVTCEYLSDTREPKLGASWTY